MDFIPSASNTYGSLEDERLPFEVPYVGTFTYDFEGFEDFPKRLGFMKDGKLDLETRSLEDCASLMQSWLYFGVICEFIDRPIEVSKFVHISPQEEGRDVLRWNPCGNEAIDDWKTRMVHLNEGSPMTVITAATARINSVLHHAASHVLEIEQLSFAQTAPIPTICLSIKALLDVLFGALKPWGIYSNPDFAPPYLPVLPHDSNKIPASTYFLMSMMSHQGWCPSQIRGLFQKMDLCTLLFLSQLSRKRGNGTGHSSCSALQCIANNVDMSHYETKHRTPSCRCNTVEVPKSSLVEIIKSGGIPLVSVHAGPYDTIEIHIEKADPSTQYIAISHVWSDGLGNPNSNALPQCQLAWLSSCLERLPPPGYQGISYSTYDGIVMDTSALDAIPQPNAKRPVPRFWMDTLCVPVGNEYAELKTEAINKMAAYYAQATRTLILDGELQGLHLAVLGATEVLARIAHCTWAGRCWTLQEGAISSICYFQCADGALRLDGMNRSQQLKWVLGTSSPVNTMSVIRQYFREGLTEQRVRNLGKSAEVDPSALNELFIRVIQDNFLFRQRVLKYGDVNPAMRYNERVQNSRFITVWNELSQRTTTKLEDIYVIVANLLDFNSGQIMELPAEERLKAVLWSGRYVPLSLLYSDGPRVAPSKNNRERWVPKTPRGSTLDKFPNLEFVADGLLLQSLKVGKHATIMLSRRFYMNRYCFMVNPERRKTYFVKAIRADPDEFQTDTDVATCYIFESAKGDLHDGIGPELKGTCLSISSMKRKVQEPPNHSELTEGGSSQATISLVAIHDCPVRVWEVEHSTMVPASELIEYELLYKSGSAPIVHVEYLKSQWEVVLQTETPRLENAYPRRPFPSSLGSLLHVTFALFVLFILFLGLPFNILLTIKWVQRMENLSKPSIASICLFYVLDIYPPAAIASGLCAIVANLCNIPFGSRHQMGQIFIWAIVQFCVLYLPAPLLVAAFNFGLRGYAYAAWLSTFDEDWSQKNKYALWWKFIGFGLWMSNLRDWAAKKTKCLLYNAENKLRILDWASMWKQKGLRAELAEGAKRNKIETITFDDVIALNLLH